MHLLRQWFAKGAELDDCVCMHELARLIEKKLINCHKLLGRDYSVLQLITKTAQQEYPMGLYDLGVIYYTGEYGNEDKQLAASHFKRAAELGYSEAYYNLATMFSANEIQADYKYGNTTNPNITMALVMLKMYHSLSGWQGKYDVPECSGSFFFNTNSVVQKGN